MRICVTGGAGFIGSNLTKRLVQDGHEVVVYDLLLRGNKIDADILPSVKLIVGDIRNKDLLIESTRGCPVVFHLAAILGVDIVADNPVETMDVEAIGMYNLGQAAVQNGIKKILYASTSGIYGHSAIEKSVTEEIMVDPRSSYAMAKRFNEIYLAALFEEKRVPSVALRFFNVFGYNQDSRMVIPRFYSQAISGEPITVFGDGKQTRDFTFIDDAVESCVRLMMHNDACEIYNIANESERTIEELAIIIKELAKSDSEIRYVNVPSKRYDFEVERRVGSSEKLYNAVGFRPVTSLEEGLRLIYGSASN